MANLSRGKRKRAYEEYMRSREWHLTRREIIKLANGICEHCKKNKAVQVHHKTYARFGREHPEDLMAVCHPCHLEIHGISEEQDRENQRRRKEARERRKLHQENRRLRYKTHVDQLLELQLRQFEREVGVRL